MTKQEMRLAALARRDALEASSREDVSSKLTHFASDLACLPSQTVSGFLPIRSEIDLRPLMTKLHAGGVPLCLPVVLDRETIVFRRFDPGMELVDTGFGTSGPGNDAQIVDPDVMLMPLAGFDGQGNRLGYGAGHYDRAIARLLAKGKRPRLIGCAFACQRLDSIPAEPHDVPLDAVLTEDGFRPFQRDA